ncbi:MAG: hypothetical protein RMJ07_00940 [Nitrososphaerota archaeon]|nr:hypothetical protein [Candidatus Bathyarchaeota archaeon]MDW8048238.1 hypothetical protein [Nitrososphaerota archaeon]
MSGIRINIFYVISSVCCLLLIWYSWMVFLPLFEYTDVYSSVRMLVIGLTIIFLALSGILLYLSISKKT